MAGRRPHLKTAAVDDGPAMIGLVRPKVWKPSSSASASAQAVTRVAMDLGYASPAAFASAFRQTLGDTPTRYLEAHRTA
ncbi:hypothetical protein A9973_01610 [Achromobacter sp. UMC46]|nr:hypothetical protein [Achromobacter sp. UMC46]